MDDDGTKPVSHFRSERVAPEHRIGEDVVPAALVRALRINTRLSQINRAGLSHKRAERDIRKAMGLVSEEMRNELMRENPIRFVEWFANSLGHDLGVLHKNGEVHRWLHAQNITLDARIVDTDSVRSRKNFETGVDVGGIEDPFRSFSFDQFVEKDKKDLRATVLSGCKHILEHVQPDYDSSILDKLARSFDSEYARVTA
ncbi:hypothetical protein HY969_01870 [Candidatus Kaiserbacteria bacterium]|nr:hypothetical protein [Candidatus Kaiserbacteria bacterium]